MMDPNESPGIDLATRNMLAMIELIIDSIAAAAKQTVRHNQLLKPFMQDLIEFNTKMKQYKDKEIQK